MTDLRYANRIISDTGFEATRVAKVDRHRLRDFFSVNCTWFWRSDPDQVIDGTRTSECNQVIGLVGAHPEDPFSLAGEVTVRIDGKKAILTKSSLIFVPAGVPFGPVQIDHMEHPIFYASVGVLPNPDVKNDPSIKPAIISQIKEKAVKPPTPAKRTLQAVNILHMEDDLAKGSFYVNLNWFYGGYGEAPAEVHDHEWPELISFYGSDPQHPHDLGGIFSIDMDGETHYMSKSSLICIPAHTKHCPWKFLRIDRPILTMTASPSGLYYSSEKDRW